MARVLIKESVADFPAAEVNLEKIRTFLRDRLLETPLGRKEITGLLLAVEEAVTNIIRHGYLYGPGEIRLRVAHDRNQAMISLFDSGRSFDWPKKSSSDYNKLVETSRKGGLGIVLIEKVCDSVEYRRTASGQNELLLGKSFKKKSAGGRGLSLRWRWAAAGMALSTALAAAFFFIAGLQSEQTIRERVFADWTTLARTAASASANLIINRATDVEFDELAVNLAADNRSVDHLVITDHAGSILADTKYPEMVHTPLSSPAGVDQQRFDSPQAITLNDAPAYYLVSPVRVDRNILGYVYLTADPAIITAELNVARTDLALYATGGMIVLWLLSILLSGWLVRPFKKLSGSIARMGGGSEDAVAERGGDEIRNIVEAFDSAAQKIQNAERTHFSKELARREWETAEQLQKALILTEPPKIPGFEIGTLHQSAKFVGGDWYDIFALDEHTFIVCVADVSGKGVPGALVMATVRTAVRLLADKHRQPDELLSAVHTFVAKNMSSGMFVTMFLALVDSNAGNVSFASAGHTPMLFYRRGEKQVFEINPRGWPLGMQLPDGASFEKRLEAGNLPLEPGDVFVLYTDGVSEARNTDKEFFGAERLQTLVADEHRQSASAIAGLIEREVGAFAGDAPASDDIAVVVVKRTMAVSNESQSSESDDITITPRSKAVVAWDDDQTDVSTRRLLEVIASNPEFDLPQIRLEIGREEYGAVDLDENAIRRTLFRLRLDDRQSRFDFAAWAAQHEKST